MAEPVLRFDNVSYVYGDGTRALDNVSFTVAQGESAGIIGHNGSGKTTLLMHAVGLLASNGSVVAAGFPVVRSNLNVVRRKVGYVFQDPRDQLFMSRVIEDVSFGPLNMGLSEKESFEKAENALDAVGLHGFGSRISYHLSSGEMRRAAIATILAMNPEIIIMDEPTSGLDPRAKRELVAVIRSLPSTKLIASHDLSFIGECTERVIVLHKGRIAAEGQTGNILADNELLLANGL